MSSSLRPSRQGARPPPARLVIVEFWAHAARDAELRRQFALRRDALKRAVAGVIERMLARTDQRFALALEHVAMIAIALGNGSRSSGSRTPTASRPSCSAATRPGSARRG